MISCFHFQSFILFKMFFAFLFFSSCEHYTYRYYGSNYERCYSSPSTFEFTMTGDDSHDVVVAFSETDKFYEGSSNLSPIYKNPTTLEIRSKADEEILYFSIFKIKKTCSSVDVIIDKIDKQYMLQASDVTYNKNYCILLSFANETTITAVRSSGTAPGDMLYFYDRLDMDSTLTSITDKRDFKTNSLILRVFINGYNTEENTLMGVGKLYQPNYLQKGGIFEVPGYNSKFKDIHDRYFITEFGIYNFSITNTKYLNLSLYLGQNTDWAAIFPHRSNFIESSGDLLPAYKNPQFLNIKSKSGNESLIVSVQYVDFQCNYMDVLINADPRRSYVVGINELELHRKFCLLMYYSNPTKIVLYRNESIEYQNQMYFYLSENKRYFVSRLYNVTTQTLLVVISYEETETESLYIGVRSTNATIEKEGGIFKYANTPTKFMNSSVLILPVEEKNISKIDDRDPELYYNRNIKLTDVGYTKLYVPNYIVMFLQSNDFYEGSDTLSPVYVNATYLLVKPKKPGLYLHYSLFKSTYHCDYADAIIEGSSNRSYIITELEQNTSYCLFFYYSWKQTYNISQSRNVHYVHRMSFGSNYASKLEDYIYTVYDRYPYNFNVSRDSRSFVVLITTASFPIPPNGYMGVTSVSSGYDIGGIYPIPGFKSKLYNTTETAIPDETQHLGVIEFAIMVFASIVFGVLTVCLVFCIFMS